MKARYFLLIVCLSGCRPPVPVAPQGGAVAASAILFMADDDSVLIYGDKFPDGYAAVPVGTRVTILGEGRPVPMISAPTLRVAIKDGDHSGKVVTVLKDQVVSSP